MAKNILIRPIISEKTDLLSKKQQYAFVVARNANKIQIQKAVADMYNVAVESVNTAVIPGKVKVRQSKRNVMRGQTPAYKKAYITLAAGEAIDFFGGREDESTEGDL